jgi:hypothetical protein
VKKHAATSVTKAATLKGLVYQLRGGAAFATVNDWTLLSNIEARARRQHVQRQIVQLQ